MLFKVFINQSILKKIAGHTQKPYEQIGLLIGELQGHFLKVTGAIKGEGEANGSSSNLSSQSLARIAQDIITGQIQGNIVGWYHSHLGCGVFMSEVDIETQIKLQQFSPYIIALVIDPIDNEFGIFHYLSDIGIVQLPAEDIIIT